MVYELGERKLEILGQDYFIADNAVVVGSVVLENNASIWFNVVIRADNDVIRIGENSNVQDGSVLHTDRNLQLVIGKNVTVGHKVMLHGCTVGDNTLIGINAVILNRAVIGKNCLIGANSLVPEGKVIPDNSLVMGSPAKVVRTLEPKDLERVSAAAESYVRHFKRYKTELKKRPD